MKPPVGFVKYDESDKGVFNLYALEFENVSKTFSSTAQSSAYQKNSSSPTTLTVVDSLSFFVKKGEFFSIVGPSGCGKTTSLRMISGLEKPSSGNIRMNGKLVNTVHPHKRNVHTVFQRYALFPHLNVFENVAFGLRMKKRPESEIRTRVFKMLEMVKLQDYAGRSVTQLSGGEQQRVALVRALVNEPEILLLDEPLGALDAKLREGMQQELVAIQKQTGITFIFVTHDQSEALTLSDRIAIMNKGRLEQIGTPAEIYEQPASNFVASFVGTTNFFQGRVTGRQEISADRRIAEIETKEFGRVVAQIINGDFKASTETAGLVVRPEKIRLRSTPPNQPLGPGTNVLKGQVIERTYLGATTQVKLKINDQSPALLVLLANQSSVKTQSVSVGDKFYAVWEASDTVYVPPDK